MNEYPRQLLVVCAGLRVSAASLEAMNHFLTSRKIQNCKFLMREWLSEDQFHRADLLWIVDETASLDVVHSALLHGIPLVVSDNNTFVKELCLLANCGLFYRHPVEASLFLQLLTESQGMRDALGANARAFMAQL